jgi:putative ABC transport system permease protein
VDGIPIESDARGRRARFPSPRGVSWRQTPTPQMKITAGRWWAAGTPNQLCVDEGDARWLDLKPGQRTEWTVGAQKFQATVACLFDTEEVRFGGGMDFLFSPGTLDGMPIQYFATLRMHPPEVPAFQRKSFAEFPSVTVINAADVIDIVQQVVDQIALVVRFISMFAILAGVIILASSVAATRFRRVKEVAILKTLGASRRRVAGIFSVEFLVLGAAAGVLGSLLASGFSNLLMVRLLEGSVRIDTLPNIAAIAFTAFLAVAAGWIAGYRILSRKPLEVLRHE